VQPGQIWRGVVEVLDTFAASVRRALPRDTRPDQAGRRSRRSTHWGIDTQNSLAILAPMHHAWLLLATVAAPATALVDTVIEKGAAHEAYV
jgi:hypothetical protein